MRRSTRTAARGLGRIRARILATFGEVGLPATALLTGIEALCTELNPEIVAGAAIAARGLAGSDGELQRALVQALDNLHGRDAPVAVLSAGKESTALLEILASLVGNRAVSADLVDAVREVPYRHSGGWSVQVRSASQQTVTELASRARRSSLALDEAPALISWTNQRRRPVICATSPFKITKATSCRSPTTWGEPKPWSRSSTPAARTPTNAH